MLTDTIKYSETVETAFTVRAHLLTEPIEYACTLARGMPFQLEYHEHVERAREGLSHTRRLLDQARRRYLIVTELLTFEKQLRAMLQDPDVTRAPCRLRLLNGWFEEGRSEMRLERWALSGRADELAESSVEEGSTKWPRLR